MRQRPLAIKDGPSSATRPISRTRRVLYLALALFVAAIVTATILELLTRAFLPQQEAMRWLVPDKRYGHLMKANFHQRYPFVGADCVMDVQTNSIGLRDEEVRPAEEGEKTILFLGDSFTFGYGVNIEDRFDTALASLLAQSDRRYRLINAGMCAWGTVQETRYARDHFQTFGPDIIVLTFCSNDPTDDAYFLRKGQSFDVVRFPGKVFLRHHSHLFRLLTQQAFALLHSYYLKKQQADTPEKPVDVQSASLATEQLWQATLETLRGFHQDFLAYNPEGVLVTLASNPANEDMRDHLAWLSNHSTIVYVDMYERIQSLAPGQMRLPYDGHWSVLMHSSVAKHLYRTIIDLDAGSDALCQTS